MRIMIEVVLVIMLLILMLIITMVMVVKMDRKLSLENNFAKIICFMMIRLQISLPSPSCTLLYFS